MHHASEAVRVSSEPSSYKEEWMLMIIMDTNTTWASFTFGCESEQDVSELVARLCFCSVVLQSDGQLKCETHGIDGKGD